MKTKVVAFRVPEHEYKWLEWHAKERGIKIAELVNTAMTDAIIQARIGFEKEQKRVEAKAKRDAKKAVANAE
jgi:hypothetical protein